MPKRIKHTKHKVTFTLDETTIQLLKEAAMVTGKSQSLIVREAVAQYGRRRDKMDPEERMHKLQVFRELRKAGPFISRAEADAEIEETRKARREDRRNWP